MTNYKSKRFVDRLKWVIVDENGKVINRNPSEDELKELKIEQRKSRDTLFKKRRSYTDKQLLDILRQCCKKYGRPPTKEDFTDNLRSIAYDLSKTFWKLV